jgi:hypothetical protein
MRPPKSEPDAASGSLECKESQSRTPDRYELLRQHSRGTGRASWQVWDQKAHTVVYAAINGKDALEFIDQLIDADAVFRIGTRYGKLITISNSDEETT